MEKAFAYLRVSGKGQVEGDGFSRQIEAIKRYAAEKGIEIAGIYKDEGVSGTLAERPALAEMMVSMERNGHGVRTVIVEQISRLARDLMVQETLLDDFQRSGLSVISATDGDLLEDDPTRKLVRQVLGAIAEYDKTMTVLKLRAARARQRKEKGKCEGRKSYAEAKPEVLAEIKRLRRKPRGGKRMSAPKVAESLNAAGFTSRTGKPFNAQIIRNILLTL
jgi:DNA invertase Pin-like site-specific DNA recombinase